MSDPTGQGNDTKIQLRVAVANAYAMVKGLAHAVSLSQATPEQLMQERLLDLTGPSTNPRRPSRLEMVRNTRANLKAAIEQIRSLTVEQLQFSDAGDIVNPAITGEEGE